MPAAFSATMAFLTDRELEALRSVPIEARLLYVFVLRARGPSPAFASEDDLADAIEQEIGDLLTHDGQPNHGAIRARIRAMLEAGLIAREDAAVLKDLLLDQH